MGVQHEPRVFTYPNVIVTVEYADITDEERAKRMEEIKEAAEAVLREVFKAEARKKKNNETYSK